jgi:hypothetical protein
MVAAFVGLLAIGALDAVREVRRLDDRRREALAVETDPAATVGAAADAFRRFRSELGDGGRFALVYGPEVDRDQRGFYRLFGGYYLYPAIAVSSLQDADAVMVFGAPTEAVTRAFEQIATVDGIWLGRRGSA